MVTGTKRVSASLIGVLLACESPSAPGSAPASALPPSPAANACAPARQIGGEWFHFADVIGGNSCPVYLEQDECVLGVFSDCTDRATDRQWLGRISPEGDLYLGAQRASSPPGPTCTMRLPDDATNVTRFGLRCVTSPSQASAQIVLERRIDPMPELGSLDRRVAIYPFTSAEFAAHDHYMFDMTEVRTADRREVWFTVDDDRAIDAGLYVLDLGTRQLASTIAMPAARLLVSAGSDVIAASQLAVMKVDTASRTPTAVEPVSGGLEPTALAAAAALDRVLVAFDPGMAVQTAPVKAFALSDLSPIGETRELPINLIHSLVAVPRQPDGTIAIAFGADREGGAGAAIGFDEDLVLTRTYDLPFVVLSARFLPERARIGAVAGNRYVELDPTDIEAPIRMVVGVPYTEAAQDFAFDPNRNRIYFLGRSFVSEEPETSYHLRPSLLTYIDLAKEEAVQEAQQIQALTRRVLVLEEEDAVIVGLQRVGTVEWVRP